MIALAILHTARAGPFDGICDGKAASRGVPRVSSVCCKTVAATCRTGPIRWFIPPTFVRRRE
eukprot:8586591-Prorocentrum_lima.AAC.1